MEFGELSLLGASWLGLVTGWEMSGDHNMNQKKPMIKIDGVEINQTTPYIDYDAWIASPLTKALKDKLEAAVRAEREALITLLKGIDQTETESPDGWWETSTGADFGTGILAAIRARGEKK
jgi:hypothetical protein